MSSRKQTSYYGFTIVELLVVIVVIAILAAITIVSYTGISSRANISSLQSDLTNAVTQLKLDQVNSSSGAFPATLALANGGKGVSSSPGTTYTYAVSNTTNPQTFCITATKNNVSYNITQDSNSQPGICPVLNLDAGNISSYPGTGTTWTDLSGNGNNGTLNGGVSYSAVNGGVLSFDGVDDWAVVPNKLTGNIGTVCFFIKDNTPGLWTDIFTLSTGVDATASRVENTGGSNYQWYGQGGFTLGMIIFAHNGVQWDYISLTFDGVTAKSYKNGNLLTQSAISGNFPIATNVNIGRRLTGNNWKGSISNFVIYNIALSIDDINQNFNSQRSRYGI